MLQDQEGEHLLAREGQSGVARERIRGPRADEDRECIGVALDGRPTLMLEIPMLVGTRGADELLRTYEDIFMRELGARPHWGLDLDAIRDTGASCGHTAVIFYYDIFPETADRLRWPAAAMTASTTGGT